MEKKDPYALIKDAEIHLDEFIQWQIEYYITGNFRDFAESTGRAQDVFKYAALLYPRFILVEGCVVLSDHYHKENWEEWRKTHGRFQTAAAVNHVHVEDYLRADYEGTSALEKELGALLAFFWQMAANQQFPDTPVKIEYDGEVIHIFQEDDNIS